MILNRINKLAMLFILISAHNSLYSFDGERRGFILGGGIGAGYLSNQTSYNSITTTDDRIVIQTNFKIGYAFNNTLELYCQSKVSWWGESDKTTILGLLAIAGRINFKNTTGIGWSIAGGLGYSGFGEPFENPFKATNGFGFFVGGGYEFTKHWDIELDLLYSKITEGPLTKLFGVSLTVNFLAY